MNGELNYDDILHFPNEIVVEKINNLPVGGIKIIDKFI